jgi:hypothetical protein
MKFFYKVLFFGIMLISSKTLGDKSSNKPLLEAFHEYGITKCDDFIVENSPLNQNWYFVIEKHMSDIDEKIKEVSVRQIYGSEGDTIKSDDSYIQTSEACYLHKRRTLTYTGPCSSNINFDYWYVSNKMPDKDYTEYTNKNGLKMFAKEISVGNFKACIHEYSLRQKYDIKQKK